MKLTFLLLTLSIVSNAFAGSEITLLCAPIYEFKVGSSQTGTVCLKKYSDADFFAEIIIDGEFAEELKLDHSLKKVFDQYRRTEYIKYRFFVGDSYLSNLTIDYLDRSNKFLKVRLESKRFGTKYDFKRLRKSPRTNSCWHRGGRGNCR